jgi:hypothetical protein
VLSSYLTRSSLKIEQVLTSDKQLEEATRAISQITEGLIKHKKLTAVGPQTMYLDIVRDVINLIPVYWLSNNIVSLVRTACSAFGLTLSYHRSGYL